MYPSELARERIADGAVHILGLAAVTASCVSLMIGASAQFPLGMTIACAIYCSCVIASFASSASYHLLPWHDWRQILRRIDHTAIYALIAGTFTPLLVYIGSLWAYVVLAAVWVFATPAMIYKMIGAKIDSKWSLASYLGLGWIGVFAAPEFYNHLPGASITAIFIGGFFYTFGTVFYARKTLSYRYAIWHVFVLLGTASFFIAVWAAVFDPKHASIAANQLVQVPTGKL